MPNFSIALTGLQADTIALNTIGNNLANLNTVAYKKQVTEFEDLFYQNVSTNGANDTLQVGVGVKASSTNNNWLQGSVSTTQADTDFALSGNGFFVVQRGNVQSLTRAGDFQTDNTGNLITTEGENVMGYGVVNGVLQTNGVLSPLRLPLSALQAASATTNIALGTSLDSTAAVGASYTAPVTVYDSLGSSHAASVVYTKATANSWNYSITLPSGDSTGAANNTGTLTFDSYGKLTSPTSNVAGVSFTGMADGAANLNITFSLFDSSNSPLVSQTAGASNTSQTNQDGFQAGTYQSFGVDGNGVITAKFSNGHTTTVGQLALGLVTNKDGLVRSGNNNFSATQASGQISFGVANVGGRGSIEGEALESSNVDISAEFANLIVAQRAFQANSKTVTTFDQVTENAIQMIR